MADSQILIGDALTLLRTTSSASVQCVVTSPPYWGLRDYGVEGQIGLEPTPAEFLAKMIAVFQQVRRVLRDDGTCWVNMGDSYANNGCGGGSVATRGATVPAGLKPKDLIGMPWRLAFALQDDGWYLRSDIIWAKPNPMPESVTDRPTKAHEYVFLLTKRARYFYDADAVREARDEPGRKTDGFRVGPQGDAKRDPGQHRIGCVDGTTPAGRNARTVWTIATQAFPEAHFATFPMELAARCIRAGTSQRGACPDCGSPWARVVERVTTPTQAVHNGAYDESSGFGKSGWIPGKQVTTTTGWEPTCTHDTKPIPCTVLDPFSGAGTTGLAANRLGRDYIGIELNPEYAEMSRKRLATDQPLFNGCTVSNAKDPRA